MNTPPVLENESLRPEIYVATFAALVASQPIVMQGDGDLGLDATNALTKTKLEALAKLARKAARIGDDTRAALQTKQAPTP